MKLSRRVMLFAAFAAAVVLSVVGLQPRLSAEKSNRTVAFVIDYRDILSLSYQSGLTPDSVLSRLKTLGVAGVCVDEYTGDEMTALAPMGMTYGAASMRGAAAQAPQGERAVVSVPAGSPYAELLTEYLVRKMPGAVVSRDGSVSITLPAAMDEMSSCNFVPDFAALDFCTRNNVNALFRPGPCSPSNGKDTAAAFAWLFSKYPCIKNITASGMTMPGYPDLQPVIDAMKSHDVSFSSVEFVKQIGIAEFAKKAFPSVLSLHSLTKDEIFSKKIDRRQMLERFVRAVHERSVRLVLVHPFDLQMGDKMETFAGDLTSLKSSLESRGYAMGWPATPHLWNAPLSGAVACALVLVFCCWFLCARFKGAENGSPKAAELAALFVLTAAAAAALYKVPLAARLAGGFCGAFFAAEAALTALESYDKPWRGAVGSLFLVLAGGLSIASFYGTAAAAMRITPFSGVKLMLMLPPLLLLAHDLQRRVHPESVPEIISRPALWGELVVIGVMMVGLLVMVLRSDNVSNVPAAEVAFRDFVERLLLVRPRTKEFMIGYPALVLYWYVYKRGWAAHYREVLRLTAVLAYCSAADTFCHFHTMLALSVVRVLNGWWLGLAVGAALAAILHFAVKYLASPDGRKSAL